MSKNRFRKVQYRHYEMPFQSFVLPLLGSGWVREYGTDVDELHFHNFFEIGYCYEGSGELVLETTPLPFSGNMFSLIPPNFLHTTNSTRGTLSRWEYLFVDVEGFLAKTYADKPQFAEKLLNCIYRDAFLFSHQQAPVIDSLLRGIIEECRRKSRFYTESIGGLLQALLVEIARLNPTVQETEHTGASPRSLSISNALDYVSANFHTRIKIADLAACCHLSETHFRRIFRKCMHMSPLDYINLVRIEMACNMLRTTNHTVEEVAIRSGFQTATSFNRNFKATMGIPPLRWRKSAGDSARQPGKNSSNIELYTGWV